MVVEDFSDSASQRLLRVIIRKVNARVTHDVIQGEAEFLEHLEEPLVLFKVGFVAGGQVIELLL